MKKNKILMLISSLLHKNNVFLNLGYLSLISLVFLILYFLCLRIVHISHEFILLFVVLYW